MPWRKRITGKCIGILVAFGCSFFVLYMLTAPENSAIEFYTIDMDNWQCQGDRAIFRTADSELCLGSRNIFFIESSRSTALNARQACAVESASHYHPNHTVLLLMTPDDTIDFDNSLIKIVWKLNNVKITKIDIANLVYGTPYYEWYKSNRWEQSPYKVPHLSDGLRLFLLWLYGGMYLDTDVVVLRSLEKFHNSVVLDNGIHAGNTVLFFDKGHPFLQLSGQDFVEHYDPHQFAANGPLLIDRNIKRLCDLDDLRVVVGAECDVNILPMDVAFPIPYERWEDYFKPSSLSTLRDTLNGSYLMHTWNWLSKGRKIEAGQNSLYELAMKAHCPMVYEYAQQFKYI